jgi:hypothetical protein
MDVLRMLGNPNKEFYREENLFLNYLELGFDVMVGPDYLVTKFILHTNYPNHPNFGFHCRCNFSLTGFGQGSQMLPSPSNNDALKASIS